MKKLFSLSLAIMLIICLSLTCFAETDEVIGKLSAKDVSSKQGNTFTVEINLSSNPGIIAAGIKVAYDSKVLTYNDCENGDIFQSIYMQSQTKKVNPYVIMWANAFSKTNIAKDGMLVKLTFDVASNAKNGDTTVSVTPMDNNVFDTDLKDRSIAGCSFKVSIDDGKYTEVHKSEQLPLTTNTNSSTVANSTNTNSNSTTGITDSGTVGTTSGTNSATIITETPSDIMTPSKTDSSLSNTENKNVSKKSNLLLYIVIIVIAAAVITLILVLFKNKNKSNKAVINTNGTTAPELDLSDEKDETDSNSNDKD